MKFSYLSFFIMGCIFVVLFLSMGMTEMNIQSPKLFKYMNKLLNAYFGLNY